jgi:two-component sensor histidine kinase
MTSHLNIQKAIFGFGKPDPAILLREATHRQNNDLQMLMAMLVAQRREAQSEETREALALTAERLQTIVQSRAALQKGGQDLSAALAALCPALEAFAMPKGVSVECSIESYLGYHPENEVRMTALIVNELAANAIKHAFAEGQGGKITIAAKRDAFGCTRVRVSDDGMAFSDSKQRDGGLGLELVEKLADSIGATLTRSSGEVKTFQLTLPLQI